MHMRVALMLLCGITIWILTPLLWLYVGSIMRARFDSIGPSLLVMMVGSMVSIVLLVKALGTLNQSYIEEYEKLNEDPPQTSPMEPILVVSAVIAMSVFGVWFFLFAGGGGPTIGQR